MEDAICPCRRRIGKNAKNGGGNGRVKQRASRSQVGGRLCGCKTGIFSFAILALVVVAALHFLHQGSLPPRAAAGGPSAFGSDQAAAPPSNIEDAKAAVDAAVSAPSLSPASGDVLNRVGSAAVPPNNVAAAVSAPNPPSASMNAPTSAGESAASDWGNYCDSEVPTYDLKAWAAEHGDVLPDHPAIFRDDVDRGGYEKYATLSKFLKEHGGEVVAGNPEYGQAGGFGANVPNHDVQHMSVQQMAAEWHKTHRYHSRFDCGAGSFCSKVWQHLRVPELFDGPSDSLNFLLGGPESGLPLHNHGKTWQGLVSGRKMWFLLPFDRVTMELHDATGPYLFPLRGWAKTMKGLPLGKRPLICVQKPREIFYFPDKWYHGTLNLDEFQLAWGGKPKNRPEQQNSPAVQAILKHYPVSKMKGADFPYSLIVRISTLERTCAQPAEDNLDEPLQRARKKSNELRPIVQNDALAENTAFAFCAAARRVAKSRCPADMRFKLASRWEQEASEMSPAVFKTECPEVTEFVATERKLRSAAVSSSNNVVASLPESDAHHPETTSNTEFHKAGGATSEAGSAAEVWGNFCDPEVPTYNMATWRKEHGNKLPDHPAIFRDDEPRDGYKIYGSLAKFLQAYGDERVPGNPEYGQAGGFGANVPNRNVKTLSVRELSQEWNKTHRYHSRFDCAPGSFCSKVWKHLGTPKLFEGPYESLNFLLGGPESGLPLHNHGKTWQGLVTGRKMWFLMPHDRVSMELHDATGPYLFPLRGWANTMKGLPLGKRPLICVQQVGDIFYFPDKWFHGTLNLDEFQLAWGGKPKNRPQQENSPAAQAILKNFPPSKMRGAEFPYSLAVRMGTFERQCDSGATQLDEPLQRAKQKAEELRSAVHNEALAENAAFAFCAVSHRVQRSKCSDKLKKELTVRWRREAKELSPAVSKMEC